MASDHLPKHPMQPLVRDGDLIRFRRNAIIDHLWRTQVPMDLNYLAAMDFPAEDRMQLAQLLGHTVKGYGEMPYVTDESYAEAEKAAAALTGAVDPTTATDAPMDDFIHTPRARVHVYITPPDADLDNGYAFGVGNPIAFLNVDWFDAPIDGPRDELVTFIKRKRYYSPEFRYLILSKEPKLTFTIERRAS